MEAQDTIYVEAIRAMESGAISVSVFESLENNFAANGVDVVALKKTHSFDYTSLFDSEDVSNEEKNIEMDRDIEMEVWYQNSSFDKNYAKTYKGAVAKARRSYWEAKNDYDNFFSQSYKKSNKIVTVGEGYEQTQVSVNYINGSRIKKRYINSESYMKESLLILKDLKSAL